MLTHMEENAHPELAPCGALWYGLREGNPDDGCGWGQLCPSNDEPEPKSAREDFRENYPDGTQEHPETASYPATCPTCRGTGGGVYNDCATCGGNGVV